MSRRRVNEWARRVHVYCKQNKCGLTVAEAVEILGPPPTDGSPPNRIMERATSTGLFRSIKERKNDGQRGRWFTARYFAVGDTPPPQHARRWSHESRDGIGRVNSIFDFAEKCSSETTK